MAKTKKERLDEVLRRAISRMDAIWAAQQDVREQCRNDRRFVDVPGAQFENWVGKQFQNRPKIEINKVAASINRIYNEYRKNRITVDFKPKDDAADPDTADILDGMYRADEQESGAHEAYDNAFNEGCKGGIGAWRLRNEYEDEEDEDDDKQHIIFEPIYDADACVFFDNDAKRYEKSDATHAFVLYGITKDAAKEKYGHDVAEFKRTDISTGGFDWCGPDFVYLAEYYEIEERPETWLIFKSDREGAEDFKVLESELEEDRQEELDATGYYLARKKTVKRKKCHKYILSGAAVIEDCGHVAGKYIPIIPFYGNRSYIDGIERLWGHAAKARDPQRLYNMQASMLAEISALSPIEKPIFTADQIAGHEHLWASDNIDRNAFLTINPLRNIDGSISAIGPVAYTKAPTIPQALAALVDMMNRDIGDVTGNQENAQDVVANTSGQAVSLVQSRLDMATFNYLDNFAKSMRWCGKVWLEMRRDIETEQRKVRTVAEDGADDDAEINVPAYDEERGEYIKNDISAGKFDVVVDVGASSSTKKEATVRGILHMLPLVQDQQTSAVLSSVAIANMEGEGMTEARRWVRMNLVRQGVIKPTEAEAQQLQQEAQGRQPGANEVYLMAEAQKAQAQAVQSQATTQKALAEAERTKAETAEILAGINSERLQLFMQALEKFSSMQQQPQPMQGGVNESSTNSGSF